MMRKLFFLRKRFLWSSLILLFCIPINNQAQSVKRECISSYGAVITSSSAIIAQTVGQPYNTTSSFDNTTAVVPGFQQPIVFKVEKINAEKIQSLELNVYPNPATYSITFKSDKLIENPIIRVSDLNGKLILSEQVSELQTYKIDCASWKNGTYIITVSDINQNKSSLKLIINK